MADTILLSGGNLEKLRMAREILVRQRPGNFNEPPLAVNKDGPNFTYALPVAPTVHDSEALADMCIGSLLGDGHFKPTRRSLKKGDGMEHRLILD